NQPKRNSKGSNVSDLPGTDTIGKTAPDDATDGAPDGQECESHRDIGTRPSEFLLERLHENRDGAIRSESQRQTDRRHADNDPAVGPLGDLVIPNGAQSMAPWILGWIRLDETAPIAGAIPAGLLDLPFRWPLFICRKPAGVRVAGERARALILLPYQRDLVRGLGY